MSLPSVFTGRYLSPIVLACDELVPCRVSMRPPTRLVPLPYELEETAWSLVPAPWMTGEWEWLSPAYWSLLDERGAEEITTELAAISARRGGRPLVLLDHEDVTRGHRSLRIVAARWLEERTGLKVMELADDGEALHPTQLPKRTRPKRPKYPGEDRRWTDDDVRDWPLTHAEVAEWIEGRHWQTARSLDHAYTRRDWGDETMFLRVVLHVREHGQQEVFAGDLYTYLIIGDHKYWTMGSDLESTVILNRKPVGQDEGEEATKTGEAPQEGLAVPLDLYGKERA